ncbi:hypothetical protein [Shimia biformata]|uniref:hypothetical protein n=1 Tax=Shimia biformata TaxID=1294299 RepID=UPI00194FB87B|nr:hypothetical protein [Shimia biformata]
MRAIFTSFALMLASALPVRADLPLACEGSNPDWYLTYAGPVAVLDFGRKTQFDIPQRSVAEGRADWPRAYTLIAEADTAILLVDEVACETPHGRFPIRAHVLTQRGQTPILLTGCCTVAE